MSQDFDDFLRSFVWIRRLGKSPHNLLAILQWKMLVSTIPRKTFAKTAQKHPKLLARKVS